jgi:hypothetical protein
MVSVLAMTDAAIMTNYDLSPMHKVVDVGTGGGDGSLIASILKKNPNVEGFSSTWSLALKQREILLKPRELKNAANSLLVTYSSRFPVVVTHTY